jgi:D-aminoacyl-tRNA deacylase
LRIITIKETFVKALIQRVTGASVSVDGRITGEIKQGLVALLGVGSDDSERDADYLADKIVNLRVFSDDDGKFNLSLLQVGGGLLVISQFTLMADTSHGRRPSFTGAALPEKARQLYEYYINKVKESGVTVATGIFAAHMRVQIVNDGPVTIMLDSKDKLP